jgi:uncharacterized protein YecE (DUF72 family)
MTGTIVCGTCGYDYPEWRDIFYPAGMDRKNFLSYYASKFTALEVNFTYYRMPTEYQFRAMMEKTEQKLLFSIKAPQVFTHDILETWEQDVVRFRAALLPLLNAGVLSAVLFQFPQSFHYTPDNRKYLSKLLDSFPDTPKVVEFRHNEWFSDRVYEGLSKRSIGLCMCDMPQLKALPSFIPIVTGNIGYIRFHGRNSNNWYNASGENGSSRYEYLYSKDELQSFIPDINKMNEKAKIVHVFFNNHPKGGAVVNALMINEILGIL